MDAATAQAPLSPLFGCPGLHLRRPQGAVYRLEWMRVHPPHERARVKANTCEQCSKVAYEFLQRGGLYLIRRIARGNGAPVVNETPSVPSATAAAWWDALVGGTAR